MTDPVEIPIKIAALLMVKNEEHCIARTIQSVNKLDAIVVFDTGSTDDTVNVIRETATVPLFVKEGLFVNFADSRNELLDFGNELAKQHAWDYFLLIDANDCLIGNIPPILPSDIDGFYIQHEFKYGTNVVNFLNIKLIKTLQSFKYTQPTHEFLNGCDKKEKLIGCKLYQDRTNDDKTNAWAWDKKILEREYENNPDDERVVFYLAQTYSCLNEYDKAIDMYKIRLSMGGFKEELYESNMRIATMLNNDESLLYYHRAYYLCDRVEPLVKIAEYFRLKDKPLLAYMYSKLACSLPYPTDCYLFVNKTMYEYNRWYELSIAAYYAKDMATGIIATNKCIDFGLNVELHLKNLKFYQ
jgi:glycosyltransferase involved in cell wall biosynthesis